MALLLQPPSPPSTPLSYTLPSVGEIQDINMSIIVPLERAIGNAVIFLQDLQETPNESFKYHLLLNIYDALNLEMSRPMSPVLYPSSLLTDPIAAEVCSIQADLNDLPNKLAHWAPPCQDPPTNTATLAALDQTIDDLKKETSSSLKSLAEAVTASTATPTAPPPHGQKSTTCLKRQPPSSSGNPVLRLR